MSNERDQKDPPPDKREPTRTSVSLPDELATKLREFSEFHHVSMGAGVRMALAQFFADQDDKAGKIIDQIFKEAEAKGWTKRTRPPRQTETG